MLLLFFNVSVWFIHIFSFYRDVHALPDFFMVDIFFAYFLFIDLIHSQNDVPLFLCVMYLSNKGRFDPPSGSAEKGTERCGD